MAIDAYVAYVDLKEDGSGTLHLCDRVPNGSRGQDRLHFTEAPHEVTALNGLPIWGGDQIMLGDIEIARRAGYTQISFSERERFLAAVAAHHQKARTAACPTCHGLGRLTPARVASHGACPACKGTGHSGNLEDETCHACAGGGRTDS